MYFNLVIWSIIKYFTPFAFVSICLIFSSNSSRQRSVFCWVEFQLKALVWECESNEISNGARPIVSLPNKAHYFCHFLSAKLFISFISGVNLFPPLTEKQETSCQETVWIVWDLRPGKVLHECILFLVEQTWHFISAHKIQINQVNSK